MTISEPIWRFSEMINNIDLSIYLDKVYLKTLKIQTYYPVIITLILCLAILYFYIYI